MDQCLTHPIKLSHNFLRAPLTPIIMQGVVVKKRQKNCFFFNSALQQGKWLPYFDIISNQWWMFITTAYGGKGVAIEGVKTAQKSSNIAVAPQKTIFLLSLLILSIFPPKILKISKNLWPLERTFQKLQSQTSSDFLAWFF